MPTVTVPGATNDTSSANAITFSFSTGTGLTIAQQISNALAAAVSNPAPGNVNNNLKVTNAFSGAIPAPSGSSMQELVLALSSGQSSVVPAGYGFVANISNTPNTTIQAAAGTAILAGAFGGTFLESGSATITAGSRSTNQGNSVISQTGSGSIMLAGGDGNDTISAAGSGTLSGGAGTNTILMTGGGEYLFSEGIDAITVSSSSGVDTVDFSNAQKGSTYTLTGAATVITKGAIPGGTITAAAAADTAYGADGQAASFDATKATGFTFVAGANSQSTITGGGAGATLFGGSGGVVTYNSSVTGGGAATFVATGGSSTLDASGSSAPVTGWAGTGNTVLTGGSGNDTMVAGAGGTTMTGGGGADIFAILASASSTTATLLITDFNVGQGDTLAIFGYQSSAGTIQTNIVNAGGAASFKLSDGTTVTFSGISVGAAAASIRVQTI